MKSLFRRAIEASNSPAKLLDDMEAMLLQGEKIHESLNANLISLIHNRCLLEMGLNVVGMPSERHLTPEIMWARHEYAKSKSMPASNDAAKVRKGKEGEIQEDESSERGALKAQRALELLAVAWIAYESAIGKLREEVLRRDQGSKEQASAEDAGIVETHGTDFPNAEESEALVRGVRSDVELANQSSPGVADEATVVISGTTESLPAETESLNSSLTMPSDNSIGNIKSGVSGPEATKKELETLMPERDAEDLRNELTSEEAHKFLALAIEAARWFGHVESFWLVLELKNYQQRFTEKLFRAKYLREIVQHAFLFELGKQGGVRYQEDEASLILRVAGSSDFVEQLAALQGSHLHEGRTIAVGGKKISVEKNPANMKELEMLEWAPSVQGAGGAYFVNQDVLHKHFKQWMLSADFKKMFDPLHQAYGQADRERKHFRGAQSTVEKKSRTSKERSAQAKKIELLPHENKPKTESKSPWAFYSPLK